MPSPFRWAWVTPVGGAARRVRAVAARGQGVRMLRAAQRVVDALVRHHLVQGRERRRRGEAAGEKPAPADLERPLVLFV